MVPPIANVMMLCSLLAVINPNSEAQTLPDVPPSLIVEPFVAMWCANQFPDELVEFDGYEMAAMVRKTEGSHVKLEPFLGEWCFDQFPQVLPSTRRENEVSKLYKNHKQVKPYLRSWGVDSSRASKPFLISLEPCIGRWCAAQFPNELGTLSRDPQAFFNDARDAHVKLEPALAKWCFAQFPVELDSDKLANAVAELKDNHISVENNLIRWAVATLALPQSGSEPSSNGGLIAWASIATAALVITLTAQMFFFYRRRRSSAMSPGIEQTDPDMEVNLFVKCWSMKGITQLF